MAIRYGARVPGREVEVDYFPRTEAHTPKALTVVPKRDAHELFLADLRSTSPVSQTPIILVETLKIEESAADTTARLWHAYSRVREALASTPDPDARAMTWKRWSVGVLSVHAAEIQDTADAEQILCDTLGRDAEVIKSGPTKDQGLHPVAEAVRSLLAAQVYLRHQNGASPKKEFLPPSVFVDPCDLLGLIAVDSYLGGDPIEYQTAPSQITRSTSPLITNA